MKTLLFSSAIVACLTTGVWAQTAPAQGNAAPQASSGGGKRAACQAAAQSAQGQERRDQMQLCLAQARVDCLKQAIDQKVIGPQRRDFVRNCVGTDGRRERSDTSDE